MQMVLSLKMEMEGKDVSILDLYVAPNASNLIVNIALYTIKFTKLYNSHTSLGVEFSNQIAQLQNFNYKHRELIATHSDRKYRDRLYNETRQSIEKMLKHIASTFGLKLEIAEGK